MSYVKIVDHTGDFAIVPRAEVREVHWHSGENVLRIRLTGLISVINTRFSIGQNMTTLDAWDDLAALARVIMRDLDPDMPDTRVTWTQASDGTWSRAEER